MNAVIHDLLVSLVRKYERNEAPMSYIEGWNDALDLADQTLNDIPTYEEGYDHGYDDGYDSYDS